MKSLDTGRAWEVAVRNTRDLVCAVKRKEDFLEAG